MNSWILFVVFKEESWLIKKLPNLTTKSPQIPVHSALYHFLQFWKHVQVRRYQCSEGKCRTVILVMCLFSHNLFCFVSFLIKDYYSSFYLIAKTSLSTNTKKEKRWITRYVRDHPFKMSARCVEITAFRLESKSCKGFF